LACFLSHDGNHSDAHQLLDRPAAILETCAPQQNYYFVLFGPPEKRDTLLLLLAIFGDSAPETKYCRFQSNQLKQPGVQELKSKYLWFKQQEAFINK